MEIGAITPTLTPSPYQGAGAGRDVRRSADEAASITSTAHSNRQDDPSRVLAEREGSVKKDVPAAEPARSPGIRFEYEDNHRVMRVHNSKGVLIYQVPSKGQLALIAAEDSASGAGIQLSV